MEIAKHNQIISNISHHQPIIDHAKRWITWAFPGEKKTVPNRLGKLVRFKGNANGAKNIKGEWLRNSDKNNFSFSLPGSLDLLFNGLVD